MLEEEVKKRQGNFGNHYRLGCCATPSDKREISQGIIPNKRHRIVEKNKRETNHVERFNNTLR